MHRLVPLALLALLALLASAASAESVWLRGRGNDVWIERDGAVAQRTAQDAASPADEDAEARDDRDERKGVTVTRVVSSANPTIARSYRLQQARREAYERSLDEPRSSVIYVVPTASYSYPEHYAPYVYRTPSTTGPSPHVYSPVYHYPRHLRSRSFRHHGFGHDRSFRHRHRHRGDPVVRIPSAQSFRGEDGGFELRGGAYRRR